MRRAVQARAWHAPVVRLRQPIDRIRLGKLGGCDPVARRALVSSNYVYGPRARLIEGACRASGLHVVWIGATSRTTATPELELAGVELVIGLGRTVLEAMAAGRAAYVYGIAGGDGWVTPERYPAMEGDGFAGTSDPELVVDAARLTRELQGWRAEMGEVNRDLASAHHSASEHAMALVELARSLTRKPPPQVSLSDELAHLVRLSWRSEIRPSGGMNEAARLGALLGERELEAATLRSQQGQTEAALARTHAALSQVESARAEADAALRYLRGTRRYRLACRLAAPLDSLRRALKDGSGRSR